MVQVEAQQAQGLSERLRGIMGQLGELVAEVTELEQRQRERDQAVRVVLSQLGALTGQLEAMMPAAAAEERAQPGSQEPGDGEQVGEERSW